MRMSLFRAGVLGCALGFAAIVAVPAMAEATGCVVPAGKGKAIERGPAKCCSPAPKDGGEGADAIFGKGKKSGEGAKAK